MDALEDTDGNVRACAMPSVVELFTGPNVTDGARADLKKEMSKKNVRKTIVDSVLAKLLNSSRSTRANTPHSETSENADLPQKDYIPPSLLLQNRRPTVTGGSCESRAALTMSRSVSHGSAPRPASRAATVVSPTFSQPPSEPGSASAIEPVFVSTGVQYI